MFGEIEDNEDITREEWVQSVTQLARVSNGTPQSRQETSEAQPMEIELRPVLLMSEHSRDEPTLSRPQFQLLDKLTPKARLASLPLSLGRAYPLGKLRPLGEATRPL